jgi:hypothetical protein
MTLPWIISSDNLATIRTKLVYRHAWHFITVLNDKLEHTGPDTFTGTTDYQQIISIDTLPILRAHQHQHTWTHASTSTCMTSDLDQHWQTWNIADPAHRHISSMSGLLEGLPGTCELISNETSRLQTSSKKIAQRSVVRLPSTLVRWITHPSRRVHCAGEAHQLPTITPARTSVPPQLSDQSSQSSPNSLTRVTLNYICGSIYTPARGAQERRWCSSDVFFSFLSAWTN